MANVLIRVLKLAEVVVLVRVRIVLSSKLSLSEGFTVFLDWLSSIWRLDLLIRVRNIFVLKIIPRTLLGICRHEIALEVLVVGRIEPFSVRKLKRWVLSVRLNLRLLMNLWIIDILILKPRHLERLTVSVPNIGLVGNLLLGRHLDILGVAWFLWNEILVIHGFKNWFCHKQVGLTDV